MKKYFLSIVVLCVVYGVAQAQTKVSLTTHNLLLHANKIVQDSTESAYEGVFKSYTDGRIVWEQKGKTMTYLLKTKDKEGVWPDLSTNGRIKYAVDQEGSKDKLIIERENNILKVVLHHVNRNGNKKITHFVIDKFEIL